jgi:hypothetical protein
MAKIVRFDELGGPEVLRIKEEKTNSQAEARCGYRYRR